MPRRTRCLSRPDAIEYPAGQEMADFVREYGEEPDGVNGQPSLDQVLRLQHVDEDPDLGLDELGYPL